MDGPKRIVVRSDNGQGDGGREGSDGGKEAREGRKRGREESEGGLVDNK